MRPKVLGAMLTTLSKAMGLIDSVKVDRLPRMADWVQVGLCRITGPWNRPKAFPSSIPEGD